MSSSKQATNIGLGAALVNSLGLRQKPFGLFTKPRPVI
jgi:hypothetical protein